MNQDKQPSVQHYCIYLLAYSGKFEFFWLDSNTWNIMN